MSSSKRHQRRQATRCAPVVEIEFTGDDIFIKADGTRVAKRGDMEWVPLEPGWQVFSSPGHEEIDIAFDAPRVQ